MTDISTEELSTKSGQQFNRNGIAFYSLSCALSLILFFAYGSADDILNDDGINYIYAAHAIAEDRPEQAKSYRPEVLFYSQITFISTFTGLDLYLSAQFLNLFWQVFLAGGFIAILRVFDTSWQSQIIALAVFFSMMSLNQLRPDIIRGFGFWALQLWAVWAGLSFVKQRVWRFALLWLALSSASILYRAEGIAYLLLIPMFTLLSAGFLSRLTIRKGLIIGGVILLASGAIWLILSPEFKPASANIPHLTQSENFSVADTWRRELLRLNRSADNFSQLKSDITEVMPNKWAQRSVNDLLIGGFIFHVLLTIIKTSNTPLIALSLYRGNIKRPFLNDPRHKLLAGYISVGIIVGLVSVYSRYFISVRYVMLPAILIGIPVTLILSKTYRRFTPSHQAAARVWKYILCALPLLACIYPLSRQNDDKFYIQEAGQWIKTHLQDERSIYFNEQKVAFYTDDYANDSFKKRYTSMQSLVEQGYQYAVLYKNEHLPPQKASKEQRLITFTNSRDQAISVYKLSDLNPKTTTINPPR